MARCCIAGQTQGELPGPLQAETSRPLIFSTCLQELQMQPTVAVIEDIHWADEATLDLLKYLGRRIHLTPSLLVVTYRDDELSPQHPLRLLLGDLATSPDKQPGFAAELAYWRWQAGDEVETFDWMVPPFVPEIHGDWRGAAASWEALGCPYEQARALAGGDGEAQKAALVIFEQLNAHPMAGVVRQKLRHAGVQVIPRGPRATTRENPFGLTNRQVEILTLLTEELTNAEIATRLHISPKTVDHHVSAILTRLNVSSREEAAELARRHPDL